MPFEILHSNLVRMQYFLVTDNRGVEELLFLVEKIWFQKVFQLMLVFTTLKDSMFFQLI